jgi:hypothetical protein
LRSFAPPSVLPDISPSRGEITLPFLLSPIVEVARGKPSAQLRISPLEGEMSGRTEGGVTKLKPESSFDGGRTLSFATINAQAPTVIYFTHNGCVFARVAIDRAKALNNPITNKGEKS